MNKQDPILENEEPEYDEDEDEDEGEDGYVDEYEQNVKEYGKAYADEHMRLITAFPYLKSALKVDRDVKPI